MQKILIDTNVVLDIALNREPFVISASLLFDKIDDRNIKAFISAYTITDIFYIIAKVKDCVLVGLPNLQKLIKSHC